MIMKFRPIKLCRISLFKLRFNKTTKNVNGGENNSSFRCNHTSAEVKWELRPGGMLVQKREIDNFSKESVEQEFMVVRVVTDSRWHDVSIHPTSTFGEMKMILSLVTGLEPKEQRLLFKGKERDNEDYLHMIGVRDNDKVLMFQDPATKERKSAFTSAMIAASYRAIIV